MKKIFIFTITLFVSIVTIIAFAKSSTTTQQSDNILSDFITNTTKGSVLYIINKNVDLRNKRIKLPPHAILKFNNGLLSNGIIVGDSTQLIPDSTPIFENIIIEGSWKIETVKTDYFLDNNDQLASNLSSLLSDKIHNNLIINEDIQVPIKKWASFFNIKSNTDVILNADIYTLPTDYKGGYCINIDGHNIKVNGKGHYMFGTIASGLQKEYPQWLHGININKNSFNVEIDNLHSWLFCGDGFYNAGSNVILKGVNAKFNGRQGLSITNGTNIKVLDSSFTYTGFYRLNDSGGPGAGIDVEPNSNDYVNNVLIERCILNNNNKYRKGYQNDLSIVTAFDCNVTVKNCSIPGIYLGSCSHVNIIECTGIKTILGVNNIVSDIILYKSGNPELSDNLKGKLQFK